MKQIFQHKNYSAFSLVELLVTVAIVGILATLAVANFDTYRRKTNDLSAISTARSGFVAANAYFADNPDAQNITGYACFPLGDAAPAFYTSSGPDPVAQNLNQILPGFVKTDKKVSSRIYFFGRNIAESGATHCYGSPGPDIGHYNTFTREFVYGTNDSFEITTGGFQLSIDGSNCNSTSCTNFP